MNIVRAKFIKIKIWILLREFIKIKAENCQWNSLKSNTKYIFYIYYKINKIYSECYP